MAHRWKVLAPAWTHLNFYGSYLFVVPRMWPEPWPWWQILLDAAVDPCCQGYKTLFVFVTDIVANKLVWQSIVLFERMLPSQISWRISEPPKSWLTIFSYLLFYLFLALKILRFSTKIRTSRTKQFCNIDTWREVELNVESLVRGGILGRILVEHDHNLGTSAFYGRNLQL